MRQFHAPANKIPLTASAWYLLQTWRGRNDVAQRESILGLSYAATASSLRFTSSGAAAPAARELRESL